SMARASLAAGASLVSGSAPRARNSPSAESSDLNSKSYVPAPWPDLSLARPKRFGRAVIFLGVRAGYSGNELCIDRNEAMAVPSVLARTQGIRHEHRRKFLNDIPRDSYSKRTLLRLPRPDPASSRLFGSEPVNPYRKFKFPKSPRPCDTCDTCDTCSGSRPWPRNRRKCRDCRRG